MQEEEKQTTASGTNSSPEGTKRATKLKVPRDLNAVESAFTNRFIRMKAEESALEAEAEFVGRMEEFQIRRCGKAIFAPNSLTAMVLSAVVELEPQFRNRRRVEPDEPPTKSVAGQEVDEDEDSDDDDDIPLIALGKRESPTKPSASIIKKRRRVEMDIPKDYIANLLVYISGRWGHVYREPSELEHAW